MANGDGVQLPKGFMGIAAALIITLTAAFILFGANTKINELSSTVSNLEADVADLEEQQEQIEQNRVDIADLSKQVDELAKIRDDIIQAICEVTGGEGPQCVGVG